MPEQPQQPTQGASPAQQPQQLTPEQQQALQEKLKNMSPEELKQFQKQQCIFCQIISGKIPSKKIYEDEQILAILDINPAAQGHLLLLPKEHYAIMPQVPDAVLGNMFFITKKLSQVQLKGLKVSGTSLFIANGMAAGQRAQHFMIHLISRKDGDGILTEGEKVIDESEREKVLPLIEKRFNQLMGLKKEVVKVGKKVKEEKEEGEKGEKIVEAEFEEEKEEPTETAPSPPPLDEIEEEKKKSKKRKKKTVKKGKKEAKKKTSKKETKKKPAKPSPGYPPLAESKEEYPEASLDDIAELFK